MKNRIKLLLAVLALLLATVFLASCSSSDAPYEDYGEAASVRYDANGGSFTTNTQVIVDSYPLSELTVNRFGKYEIPLVDPGDDIRGQENSFLASKAGYFLAGWYTERIPVTDGDGNQLDANGNIAKDFGTEPAYTYSGYWDFDNDMFEFDKKSYSADEPVLTLYAAWIPEFSFEFYDIDTGKLIKDHKIDPMYVTSVSTPTWDVETGKLDLHEFPEVENKTFKAVYLDPDGKEAVTDEKIYHTAYVNFADATVVGNPVMKLYVEMYDGKWYNVYTAEQFVEISDPTGNYNILADLDFSEEDWDNDFMYGEFSGAIYGNGHTFKNITFYQSNANEINAGLFGTLTADALIENVRFENLDFYIENGSRRQGASFGLFAGVIESGAVIEDISVSGNITITPTPYITADTVIGLFCGSGYPGGIDISGIRCVALPRESEYDTGIALTIDGNDVIVEVIAAEED